jgi:mannose-6-phosphate isomerase-like protein (cupin superfamily)
MEFVRLFDADKAVQTPHTGYRAQTLSSQESALIIASWIDEGGHGPGLHFHDSDQSYYLVDGSMTVQLGSEIHRIEAGTFVHIPAGLAHRNWNESGAPEFHVELIVPCPRPGAPLLHFVERPEDAPLTEGGSIVSVREEDFVVPPTVPGMGVRALLHNDRSVVNAIHVVEGGEGPRMHIHEFDQYYVVLEGALQVEVALERHTVPAGSLVLLPAGVPHRQWNEGPGREMHLALLAPAPREGVPWDRGVDIAYNGVEHSG